jgi:hypothetical protein
LIREDNSMTSSLSPATVAMSVMLLAGWPQVASAQENPAEIIAAHIRTQGYRCNQPKGAEHQLGVSRPNEQVWILQCESGAYRVRLVPDLAAQVERLN